MIVYLSRLCIKSRNVGEDIVKYANTDRKVVGSMWYAETNVCLLK